MHPPSRYIAALVVSSTVHAAAAAWLPAPTGRAPDLSEDSPEEAIVLTLAPLPPEPPTASAPGDTEHDEPAEHDPAEADDAPTEPEPEPEAQDGPEAEEEQPKPKPKPEPEPNPDLREFVWTDDDSGPAPDAEPIAAHDRDDDVRVRPRADEGDPGPRLHGVLSRRSGNPKPVDARREEQTQPAAGAREAPESPTRVRESVVDDPADTPGEGSAREHLEERRVVDLEETSEAEPEPDRDAAAALSPDASSDPGELDTRLLVDEGWAPLAQLRVAADTPSVQTPAPTPERTRRPREVRTEPQEMLPDPTRHAELHDRPDERDEEPTPATEHTRRSHDARAHEKQAGGDAPAQLTEPWAPQRAIRASFDEASDVEEAAMSARATPLGRWMREVSQELRKRWSSAELPMLDRAFELDETVVIAFRVTRSGRVRDIRIVEPSNKAAINAHARLTIPQRLPKPPTRHAVEHRVALEVR